MRKGRNTNTDSLTHDFLASDEACPLRMTKRWLGYWLFAVTAELESLATYESGRPRFLPGNCGEILRPGRAL